MNSELRFSHINSKERIIKSVKKRWIPVSITLLVLISGGLIFHHSNASASTTSTIHTYKLIDPENINRDPKKEKLPDNNYRNIKNNINNLSHKIVHKNMQKETIYSKTQPVSINRDINKLKLYQTKQYNGHTFSRVDTPFNKIRINRSVPLYNSLIFNKFHKISYVSHGVFNILKAFNQYNHQDAFISYLINVHNHDYYITGNPNDISFVLPSTNYRYYQNKINNILNTNPNNTEFNQINESLDSLNAQHVINFKIYLSLYLDTYNLQQQEHPIYINHSVDKQHITIVPNNNAKIRNSNQDSLTAVILKKMHTINLKCQEAANYDNQALREINSIKLPTNNENNYLKSVIANEIDINNKFVKSLIDNTNDILNYINNYTDLRFEMKNLNLQTEMANNIDINAKQILNTDVRNLAST